MGWLFELVSEKENAQLFVSGDTFKIQNRREETFSSYFAVLFEKKKKKKKKKRCAGSKPIILEL